VRFCSSEARRASLRHKVGAAGWPEGSGAVYVSCPRTEQLRGTVTPVRTAAHSTPGVRPSLEPSALDVAVSRAAIRAAAPRRRRPMNQLAVRYPRKAAANDTIRTPNRSSRRRVAAVAPLRAHGGLDAVFDLIDELIGAGLEGGGAGVQLLPDNHVEAARAVLGNAERFCGCAVCDKPPSAHHDLQRCDAWERMMRPGIKERHNVGRVGWLRATVLGANDGILSTSSLLLGVAAAHATHSSVLIAGAAGLAGGAMSMAAGEYVSVSSQADTERADLERERAELKADDAGEHKELSAIYVGRGLDPALAKKVSEQLMAHDALGAHARDELGISESLRARPLQAALASAASFAVGAAMPLIVAVLSPARDVIALLAGTSLAFLAILGGAAAQAGGAGVLIGAARVTFWGALAMACTAGIGSLVGTIL